jgi:hypothetical protein
MKIYIYSSNVVDYSFEKAFSRYPYKTNKKKQKQQKETTKRNKNKNNTPFFIIRYNLRERRTEERG